MNVHRNIADVAIVGGGVIGLLTAYRLAQSGATVTLFERDQPGQEASAAALGVLNPKATDSMPAAYTALEWASLQLYPALAAELRAATGLDVGLRNGGVLWAIGAAAEHAALDAWLDWQRTAGIPVAPLTAAQARELEPALNADTRAAVHFCAAQHVDNVLLCRALALAARQVGVQIRSGEPVVDIRVDGTRITGVQLSGGVHDCAAVILAAGSWSGGIPGLHIPVRPMKGQALAVRANVVIQHAIQRVDTYVVPRRDGRILIGATVEEAGFDTRVTVEAMQTLLAAGVQAVPALCDATIVDMWAGLRPRAGDDLPIIGPVAACEGLYLATGHFRNGILLAPITAQLMGEWLAGETPSVDVGRFSPDRFQQLTTPST